MSFDPQTGILYINTNDWGMDYEPAPVDQVANLKAGQPHYGVKFPAVFDADKRGHLRAIDPLTGKAKWELPFKSPNIAGTMATAGGLVFTGILTGEFIAVDADTGKIVWQFQTPSGIVGQPITWEKDGKQYVTVTSGIGGVYAQRPAIPTLPRFRPAARCGPSSCSRSDGVPARRQRAPTEGGRLAAASQFVCGW